MRLLLFLVFSFLISDAIFAQEENSIQRVASGKYAFAKGEILLSLSDTVSRDFAIQQIKEQGYGIIETKISPISFILFQHISDSLLKNLSNHSFVESVELQPGRYDSIAVERMITRQKMDSTEAERSRKSFRSMMETPTIRIVMKWSVQPSQALSFMELYPDLNLQTPNPSPRTITVKTKIGKEREAMKALKKLAIVTDVAYVALIGQ